MPGRHAKPVLLHIAEGNPNRLPKAEIERRKKAEIKLGDSRLKCPDYVKADPVALKKWRELIKDYKSAAGQGIDLVRSSDAGILAMYCKTFSEYMRLLDQRDRLENFEINYEKLQEHFDAELLDGLDAFFRFGPVMQLDAAINKKMDMLLKMEDRLFLNPLAKVKNVPKREKKVEDPLAERGFGNV